MRSLRILLVDDDAALSEVLAEILEDMGHVICGTETTEAGAVQAALRIRPDLMIIDASLRPGSGAAAVAAITQITPIPHIAMSGDRLPVQPGTLVTLQKPFMPRDLANAIARAVGTVQPSPAPMQ